MSKITICIATFNGSSFIRDQIDSIIKQIVRYDYEIIISDDNSTDETSDLIEKYHNHNIKFIKNTNKGLINNFENALREASGDIIFLCDQDDIWKPDKVKYCIEKLESFDLIVTDAIVVDRHLKQKSDSFFKLRNSKKGVIKNIYKNSYIGCCMAFKKNILNDALPFPPNIPMHDWWIGLVANSFYKVYFLDTPLILYRRHGKNASETSEQSTSNFFKKIQWRIILIFNLLKIIIKKLRS